MFTLLWNLIELCLPAERDYRILVIGLDNAGKSTLLNTLRKKINPRTRPTIGFDEIQVEIGSTPISFYDVGGGKRMRRTWERYYHDAYGYVFVVDAADAPRFEEAREELFSRASHPYIAGKPILVLANKQDLPEAISEQAVQELLQLELLESNPWAVYPCTALLEEGSEPDSRIIQGTQWLLQSISSRYQFINERVQNDTRFEDEKERIQMEEKRKRVEALKAERRRQAEESQRQQEQGGVELQEPSQVNCNQPKDEQENNPEPSNTTHVEMMTVDSECAPSSSVPDSGSMGTRARSSRFSPRESVDQDASFILPMQESPDRPHSTSSPSPTSPPVIASYDVENPSSAHLRGHDDSAFLVPGFVPSPLHEGRDPR